MILRPAQTKRQINLYAYYFRTSVCIPAGTDILPYPLRSHLGIRLWVRHHQENIQETRMNVNNINVSWISRRPTTRRDDEFLLEWKSQTTTEWAIKKCLKKRLVHFQWRNKGWATSGTCPWAQILGGASRNESQFSFFFLRADFIFAPRGHVPSLLQWSSAF